MHLDLENFYLLPFDILPFEQDQGRMFPLHPQKAYSNMTGLYMHPHMFDMLKHLSVHSSQIFLATDHTAL